MILYRAVQTALTAGVNVFFREIHLVGSEHVPDEGSGAVIFAGNHPNSLIDPALVVATSGRIVHFAAKDKLFAFPMSMVLSALGAVPIARAMDQKAGATSKRDNSGALDAMCAVLAAGRAIGIFPEGLSHDSSHMQRIRSGAARIALQTACNHPHSTPQIVPVGLTYMHRKSFRSQVLVQYGPPIDVDADWVAQWNKDERAAARALTEVIEAGMRSLTVNAPDWDTLRVLDGIRRMYQPPEISMQDRVALSRRFCDGYELQKDNPRVVSLMAEVRSYLDALEEAGLQDRDLYRPVNTGRIIGNVLLLGIALPLAIPAMPFHAPLYLAIDWAGRQFSPRNDVVGTSRVVLGFGALLSGYIGFPLIAWALSGPQAALAVALVLPLSGLALLRVLEHTNSLARLWTTALSSFTIAKRMAHLRGVRNGLEQQVVSLVNEFMPKDMQPLFPRDSEQVAKSSNG